jgi:hypothetical protein
MGIKICAAGLLAVVAAMPIVVAPVEAQTTRREYVYTTRAVPPVNRPRARITVEPRSFLDAGTEVLPGERKFTEYAFPTGPYSTPLSVVQSTGGGSAGIARRCQGRSICQARRDRGSQTAGLQHSPTIFWRRRSGKSQNEKSFRGETARTSSAPSGVLVDRLMRCSLATREACQRPCGENDAETNVVPGLARVAALWHPHAYGEHTMASVVKDIEDAARTLGMQLQSPGTEPIPSVSLGVQPRELFRRAP